MSRTPSRPAATQRQTDGADGSATPPQAVIVPTSGVDPRVALATGMHASQGIYAVLVGSGMSSAAGIPTGWKVVQDLIVRTAVADGADRQAVVDSPPEKWWVTQGRPEPRYDTLIEAVASTDGARRSLLQGYFDPPPGLGGPIQPTAGHEALAQLCASGRVRLILTTNFDRLIERALDQVGLTPQVIASPAAVAGMIPLVHARMTMVKLHGDYGMEGLRNTPEELRTYPIEWQELLSTVFDEFGLIVVGWSADYDVALAESRRVSPSRRYPIYWTSYYGDLTEEATRLIALRQAIQVDTKGADEFFVDLAQRVARLDEIASKRHRPTGLRTYHYMPDYSTPPPGWRHRPLLLLRTVATAGPATIDNCGLIKGRQRREVLALLGSSTLTASLRTLAERPAASADPDRASGPMAPISLEGESWRINAQGHQTTENAAFQLGGDGASGISALVSIAFPRYTQAGSVKFTLDMGISLASPIPLFDVAVLLRDGLALVTSNLPTAIAEVLPPDADVNHAEIHLMTCFPTPNDLLHQVDLTSLGDRSRDLGQLMGYAARVSGPLTEQGASELVIDGLESVVIDSGYVDPESGIALLSEALGVPRPTFPE